MKRNGYTAKLHVVSNGVEQGFEYRKLCKSSDLTGKYVIVMIGRLSNEKRQDVLIEAVAKSKHSKDIQLILAGKGPNYEKYIDLGCKLSNPVIIDFYGSIEPWSVSGFPALLMDISYTRNRFTRRNNTFFFVASSPLSLSRTIPT